MVEGVGKGARDLRTRVTERDRRVSLVGLATNRVFNGEPFVFNPLSPCDLIPFEPQDRRNVSYPSCIPYIYIYISPFPSFVIVSGCPNDWWGRYRIEFLEFNAFGRGYLSLSPFLPLDSSNDFLREDMKGEWTVETGWGRRRRNWKLERLESVARTLMRMEKKKKFWLIAGAQLFPWRHLEDTRISIFPSSSGDPRKSNLSTPLFLHITPNLLLSPSPSRSREIGNDRNRGYDKHRWRDDEWK